MSVTDPSVLADWQSILAYCCLASSATVSLLGSSAIMTVAGRKLRPKPSTGRSNCTNAVYQRLMILVSISDILSGLTLIIGPWLLPPEAGYPMAKGNATTCRIAGVFAVMLGCMPPIACGNLSLYFLFTTKYGWREAEVSRYLEKPAYILGTCVVLFFVLMSIFMEGGTLINRVPSAMLCSVMGEGTTTQVLVWIYTSINFLYAAVGIWATYQVYRHVFQITNASRAHSFRTLQSQAATTSAAFSNNSSHHRSSFPISSRATQRQRQTDARQKRLKRVAIQAILYMTALMNTLLWPTIYNMLLSYTDIAKNSNKWYWYTLGVMGFIAFPLQGAFNFGIYIQGRVKGWRKSARRAQQEMSWIKATWWAVVKPMDPPPTASQMPTSSAHTNSSQWNKLLPMAQQRLSAIAGSSRNLLNRQFAAVRFSFVGVVGTSARNVAQRLGEISDMSSSDSSSSSSSGSCSSQDEFGQEEVPWWRDSDHPQTQQDIEQEAENSRMGPDSSQVDTANTSQAMHNSLHVESRTPGHKITTIEPELNSAVGDRSRASHGDDKDIESGTLAEATIHIMDLELKSGIADDTSNKEQDGENHSIIIISEETSNSTIGQEITLEPTITTSTGLDAASAGGKDTTSQAMPYQDIESSPTAGDATIIIMDPQGNSGVVDDTHKGVEERELIIIMSEEPSNSTNCGEATNEAPTSHLDASHGDRDTTSQAKQDPEMESGTLGDASSKKELKLHFGVVDDITDKGLGEHIIMITSKRTTSQSRAGEPPASMSHNEAISCLPVPDADASTTGNIPPSA